MKYRRIGFDYQNRQGRFHITNDTFGQARIHVYGTEEELTVEHDSECAGPARTLEPARVSAGVSRTGANVTGAASRQLPDPCYLPSIRSSFEHHCFLDDELTNEELSALCLEMFLKDGIRNTPLEAAEESQIPCVVFDVTMCTYETHQVWLRADGAGWVMDEYRWQFPSASGNGSGIYVAQFPSYTVRHTVDPGKISGDALRMGEQSTLSGDLAAEYEALFWTKINTDMSDVFLKDLSILNGEPLTLAAGDVEELKSLFTDACHLDEDVWEHGGKLDFYVHSAFPGLPAGIQSGHGSNYFLSMRTTRMVDALLSWFKPKGHRVTANGRSSIHRCGYDPTPFLIGDFVLSPSATDRIEALGRLMVWSEKTGIDLYPFLPD